MRTLVGYASTAFGLATLSAAVADGAFAPADRRVLVLSNNAVVPETAYGVADVAGMGPLIEAFDDVYSYNAAVAPQHPSRWQPRGADLPIWERGLRSLWSLEGDLHLVVEDLPVLPAVALCSAFPDATIDVYAEGLRSYGPSRKSLPRQVGARVQRLLHLDLVPGTEPLLLREYGVEPVRISTESFTKVIATVGSDAGATGPSPHLAPTAVLLGQYLPDLRLLTRAEERLLHLEMVETAVAAGYPELVFKAHPAAPAGLSEPLVARAAELGARLQVREAPELVETWYAAGAVDLAVSCFSTALATAGLFGVPTARVGTELMLERLNPYPNSNRIPATVIAATVPPLTQRVGEPVPTEARGDLTVRQLVTTVGYVMQPRRNPDLRGPAAQLLEQRFDLLQPYVRRLRLNRLKLPGGQEPSLATRLGPVGPLAKRVLGPRLSRRLGRAVRRLARRRTL